MIRRPPRSTLFPYTDALPISRAIDFDETTAILSREHKQACCKSCDALDILDSKNKLNLIELKQLKDRLDIENWIEKFELPQKIKDSRDRKSVV